MKLNKNYVIAAMVLVILAAACIGLAAFRLEVPVEKPS